MFCDECVFLILVLLMRHMKVLRILNAMPGNGGNTSRPCREEILKVMEILQELLQTQQKVNKGSAYIRALQAKSSSQGLVAMLGIRLSSMALCCVCTNA